MRWPFRRRQDSTGTGATTPEPVASAAPAAPAAPAASRQSMPTRQWAALPAIPVTITRGAPLVTGPAPVLPPLRPSARSAAAPEVAPATGSVTGLTRPVRHVAEPAAPAEAVAEPLPLPPVPVVRRAARPVPAEAPPVLTDAVDEYVGEPREALEPYRAPSWLRYAANPGLPALPPFPGLPGPAADLPISEPPSFLPPELRSTPVPPPFPAAASASEPPPRMVEGVERAEAPSQRQMRQRRPNLGQTRRLGLGAPIAAPGQEALIHPDAPPTVVDRAAEPVTPQEPPSPSAAPVRVAEEPAPTPAPVPQPQQTAQQAPEPESPAEPAEPPAARTPPPPPAPPRTPPPAPEPVRPSAQADGPAPVKRVVASSYRATAAPLPVHKPRSLPRGTVVDRVPADLAHAVRARQHADVADVPVYRGPQVGEAAKARGAKAFASGGAVFLPDDAGPTDSPQARGVLAHELVHAVQQRTLGMVLPAPDSPLGQLLEAEAQTAERFYGGESGAEEPAPLIHAPQPSPAHAPESAPDLTAPAQLLTSPAQAPAPAQAAHAPLDQATRAEVGRIAEERAQHVVTEWKNPKLEQNKATTAGVAPTTAPQGQQPVFDRAARRQEMAAQTLEIINQERFEQGKEPLTDLDTLHYERIDRQLDDMQAGTVTSSAPAPQRPNYRPNSKEAWLHGLTGMDTTYGSGLTGFREPVGSEKSWWGSETKDKRPLAERLATSLGLASEDSATQFDRSSWYDEDPAQQSSAASGAGASAQPGAAAGAHAGAAAGSASDEAPIAVSRLDLDELTDRLYDRLRSRLRMELLVDRERAGLLTDFR